MPNRKYAYADMQSFEKLQTLRKKDTIAKLSFTVRVLGLSNKIKWFWSILLPILSCQKSFNILLKQFKCAGAG